MSHPATTEKAEPVGVLPRLRVQEIWLVLGLSLLRPAAFSILDLVRRRDVAIRGSQAVITASPLRVEDLVADLLRLAFSLVPVLLVGHLLTRGGEGWADLRVDRRHARRDLGQGVVIAAIIGGCGLAFYVFAVRAGITRTIIPVDSTGGPWWTTPLLVLEAAQNAVVEELIVAAYLLYRLRQIGWGDRRSLAVASVIRGSYHLYQGYGPFFGNAIMGVVFGTWLQRGRRAWPLVVAHFLIDAVVFVGWFWFRDHLSWLPR